MFVSESIRECLLAKISKEELKFGLLKHLPSDRLVSWQIIVVLFQHNLPASDT